MRSTAWAAHGGARNRHRGCRRLCRPGIAICQWLYPRRLRLRLASGDGSRLPGRYSKVAGNAAAALATCAGGIASFGELLVDPAKASTRYAPILVLLLYDAGYDWLRRALHLRLPMRLVHHVHHRTAHLTAAKPLYLHPLETMPGPIVLMICVAIVGPLGTGAFIAVSLAHAMVNVIDHTNLRLPGWPVDRLVLRHDAHHGWGGNYASITPICDWVFGTSARRA